MTEVVAYIIVAGVVVMWFTMWLNRRIDQQMQYENRSARDIPARRRYEIGE
jgi:hypothetical protein